MLFQGFFWASYGFSCFVVACKALLCFVVVVVVVVVVILSCLNHVLLCLFGVYHVLQQPTFGSRDNESTLLDLEKK